MAFLDQEGLQSLINKIQGQTIQTQVYENVIARGGDPLDTSIVFLKIKKREGQPWILKYRVISDMPDISNSTQIADVIIGGIEDKLSYYYTSNIIYDTERQSAKNHFIILKNSNQPNYVGIDLFNQYNKPHRITVELQYIYGCSIALLNEAKPLENYDNIASLESFNFFDSGTFFEGTSDNLVQRDELSNVAFSGNYEDILNKPQLLEVQINGDELLFYKS